MSYAGKKSTSRVSLRHVVQDVYMHCALPYFTNDY